MNAAVFADLCEFTRLTVRSAARRHRGRVVKTLGDGAHLHFTDSNDAVAAALGQRRGEDLPCARRMAMSFATA